ncbi:hypothetical protein PssiTeo3_02440 [Pseudomonas sichuanensis]|nr:hypothetical protein [Pseudomonas sichuanensis]
MEKNVFMSFDEYLVLLEQLKNESGYDVFMSTNYSESFTLIEEISSITKKHFEDSIQMMVLIGDKKDFGFAGVRQGAVNRQDKVGFVRVVYGGEDEHAIGASVLAGDRSEAEQKISRITNKLLKKIAHKGVMSSAGDGKHVNDRYHWTDGALSSGKNWHLFFNTGVRKPLNASPGYVPKLLP